MKRSLASGYAGVNNPLFYNVSDPPTTSLNRPGAVHFPDNNRMLFGHAKKMLDVVLRGLWG